MDHVLVFLRAENKGEALVEGCFSTSEQWAFPLFQACVAGYPTTLAIKLMMVYIFDHERSLKSKAIQLLAFSLSMSMLSHHALHQLKPLLIECLEEHSRGNWSDSESDAFFLRSIARKVTSIAFSSSHMWMELGYCLRDLANSEPLLGYNVFADLPPYLDWGFLFVFYRELLEEAKKCLSLPLNRSTQEMILAFSTQVLIGFQLTHESILVDLASDVLPCIGDATQSMIYAGLGEELEAGVWELKRLIWNNLGILGQFNNKQRQFFFQVVYRMLSVGIPISMQMALIELIEKSFSDQVVDSLTWQTTKSFLVTTFSWTSHRIWIEVFSTYCT